MQILLFKIELEPEIKSIRLRSFLPGPIKPSPPFENESNRETDKLDKSSLKRLRDVLDEFEVLSGLKTNFEKNAMMRVGNLEGEIPENICDLGFTITNSIKLLGFIIPNRDDITNVNCDLVTKKFGA